MTALAFPKIGRTPLANGAQQVSLPAGGEMQLTFPVTVPLDQVLEPGPYDTPAVLVQLIHPDDEVAINNAGAFRRIKAQPSVQNAGTPDAYATFDVAVANPTQTPQRASFAALDVVPNIYAVVFVPAVQDIPARGEATVEAQVRPPPPVGTRITIACRDAGGALLGGATYETVQ
jgi:hypothetical protein